MAMTLGLVPWIAFGFNILFQILAVPLLIDAFMKRFGLVPPSNVKGLTGLGAMPMAPRLVGVLERLLITAVFLQGGGMAVGLIFASKAIVRVRGEQSREETEYFLVGSLLSFLFAIVPMSLWLEFSQQL